MRLVDINKRKALFLGTILVMAFFVFQTPETLSFGHPDTVAPMITITTDPNIAQKQKEGIVINYTTEDSYAGLTGSSCTISTSGNGGSSWTSATALSSAVCAGGGGKITLSSSHCPNEGTAICGVRIAIADSKGNTRQHEQFYTIDGTKPLVALSSNRSDPTEQTSVTFTFSASDEYRISGFECQLNAGAWGSCTSPKRYNGPPLTEGFNTFRVRGTDVAGNVSEIKSITWEIDSKAPEKITNFVYDIKTYYSTDTEWRAPSEDGSTGGVSAQYDIRYSFKPIQTESDWNNKTTIIIGEHLLKSVPGAPLVPGSDESMRVGPASFTASDPNLLTSSLLHFFAIKSRDEKWNWSSFSDFLTAASPRTERDPCDYDADRIFSPKSACETSGGSNACDPSTETCDLYDNPFDWRLPESADESGAYDWSQSSNDWPYDKENVFWIQAFGATTKDLDQDGVDAATGRIGVNIDSENPVTGYPDPEGTDWYDNPFTLDLYSLNTKPTLEQLRNTINDLDLDTFVARKWKEIFGGKNNTDTSATVPVNADITLNASKDAIAGCIYPKAVENECYDCTAYTPDSATGRVPPGKIQASIVKNKAVCQIEAYYTDANKNDPGKPYKIIPETGESTGTIDPDEPTTSVSANCRDGIDNDLDGQRDTGPDPATREQDCPQKFDTSQTPSTQNVRGETPYIENTQLAAVFPSAGIVPCGRYADDYTTPIDESADCNLGHIFYLFDNLIKLLIGRLMPILVGLSVVFAGFLMLTSRGKVEQVLRAKKTVQWAVIAYVASLLAWMVLSTFFAVFGISKWTGVIPVRGEITNLQATSITDTGRDWETNEWRGFLVEIQPPKDSGEESVMIKISSNTLDTLTLLDSLDPQVFPSGGGGYKYHIVGTGWWSFAYDMGASAVIANFEASPNSGIAPFTVDFTDISIGDISEWMWNFGDGSPISNKKSPRHTYTTNGPFTASLTTTGPSGRRTKTRVIHYAPTADFNVGTSNKHGRAPWTVTFQDNSTPNTGDDSITNWLWSFGDGSTSDEQNPIHTYEDPGPYVVKLRVSGPGGQDTKNEINYIFVYPVPPIPEAKFSTLIIPGTLTATTTNESLFEDGFGGSSTLDDITNWLWEFIDNDTNVAETTSVKSPTYFFKTNKDGHTIRLTASGPGGNNAVETTVIFPPSANFTADKQSGYLDSKGSFTVQFQDTSTGTVSGWNWDFGDGSTDPDRYEQSPKHTYSANASYTVKLEVTNPLGETSTKIMTYYIVVSPGAYFTPSITSGKSDLNVSFTNNSQCLDACTWLWNFGDDNTSTSNSPTNSYANETYKATLTVTDSSGRSHRSDPIIITVTPKAEFTVDRTDFRGESSGTVEITDDSKTPANIEKWEWSFETWTGTFDRTDTSQPSAFTHNYSSPGDYSIILKVSGPPLTSGGALWADVKTINLDFKPIADVSCTSPIVRMNSGRINFDASGSIPSGLNYSWSGGATGTGSSGYRDCNCGISCGATVTVSNAGGGDSDSASCAIACPPPPALGCTDLCATNYDSSATTNDGSCVYTNAAACGDPAATNPASCVPPQPRDDTLCTYPPPTCTPGCIGVGQWQSDQCVIFFDPNCS